MILNYILWEKRFVESVFVKIITYIHRFKTMIFISDKKRHLCKIYWKYYSIKSAHAAQQCVEEWKIDFRSASNMHILIISLIKFNMYRVFVFFFSFSTAFHPFEHPVNWYIRNLSYWLHLVSSVLLLQSGFRSWPDFDGSGYPLT